MDSDFETVVRECERAAMALAKMTKALAITFDGGEMTVQVNNNVFVELPGETTISESCVNHDRYPYRGTKTIAGVVFLTCLTREEASKIKASAPAVTEADSPENVVSDYILRSHCSTQAGSKQQ